MCCISATFDIIQHVLQEYNMYHGSNSVVLKPQFQDCVVFVPQDMLQVYNMILQFGLCKEGYGVWYARNNSVANLQHLSCRDICCLNTTCHVIMWREYNKLYVVPIYYP